MYSNNLPRIKNRTSNKNTTERKRGDPSPMQTQCKCSIHPYAHAPETPLAMRKSTNRIGEEGYSNRHESRTLLPMRSLKFLTSDPALQRTDQPLRHLTKKNSLSFVLIRSGCGCKTRRQTTNFTRRRASVSNIPHIKIRESTFRLWSVIVGSRIGKARSRDRGRRFRGTRVGDGG